MHIDPDLDSFLNHVDPDIHDFRIYMNHVVLEVSVDLELDSSRKYMAARSGSTVDPDLAATDP